MNYHDFGTVSWHIVETIANHGYKNVYGVDYFSDEKLHEFRIKLGNSNAKLFAMHDGAIPFSDEQFDVVSSLCVVEHLIRVEYYFEEMMRVIKPGGKLIIDCPNWSSPLIAITGIMKTLKGEEFWQFKRFQDALTYLFRSLGWYISDTFFDNNFNLIYPKMRGNTIDFQKSDDDAVHLCNPIRIKKYFKKKGYKILQYNRGVGSTKFTYLFNRIFPSLASTNFIVIEKS